MRLVFDTNVLIAAIVADGLCRKLVEGKIYGGELITSAVLCEELAEKIRTKFRCDPASVPLLAEYQEQARFVTPAPLSPGVCRDADDDWVLATALAGGAECIVTGDEDLLTLGEWRGIRILTPRAFLDKLGA